MIVCSLLVACSGRDNIKSEESGFDEVGKMYHELNGSCDYPVLEKYKHDEKLMCQLNALKARCNKIDDCYVYCYGNDVGKDIGGGCVHLCNYALRHEWSSPESMEKCKDL